MTGLKRNIVSSILERGWTLALTLLVIPFQVRMLGIENYGFLGFIASVQTVFNLMDLGLGPTVIREVAADTDTSRSVSRTVVQTLATAYWVVAGTIGVGLCLSARWLVSEWLQVDGAGADEMALAVKILAISIALRWPTALYAGVLTGLHRLDAVNLLKGLVSGIRLIGGLAIIALTQSLIAYVVWLGLSTLVELAIYMGACRRLAPELSLRPGFSSTAVRQVWRFSLGMNAISILTIVFTQSDRLLIGRFLPLDSLGYYSLAYNVVAALSVIQGVVTSTLFPTLATDNAHGRSQVLIDHYASGTQSVMYLASLPAALLIFYGHDAIRVITSPAVADGASSAMTILVIGSLLSASVSVSYTLLIAAGRTRIPLLMNAFGALFYLPLLYVLVRQAGIEGAAWAWVGINLYFISVLVPFVHSQVVKTRALPWLRRTVLPFVVLALAFVGSARLIGNELARLGMIWAGALGIAGVVGYVLLGFRCLNKDLQRSVCIQLRRGPLQERLPAA